MLPRNGIWLINVLKLWGMVAGERTPGWETYGIQWRDSVLNRSGDFGRVLRAGPRSSGAEKGVGLVSEDSGVRKGAERACGRGASWSKDTDAGHPVPRGRKTVETPPRQTRGPEGPQGRPCRFGLGLLKLPPPAGGGVWEEGQEAAGITQVDPTAPGSVANAAAETRLPRLASPRC